MAKAPEKEGPTESELKLAEKAIADDDYYVDNFVPLEKESAKRAGSEDRMNSLRDTLTGRGNADVQSMASEGLRNSVLSGLNTGNMTAATDMQSAADTTLADMYSNTEQSVQTTKDKELQNTMNTGRNLSRETYSGLGQAVQRESITQASQLQAKMLREQSKAEAVQSLGMAAGARGYDAWQQERTNNAYKYTEKVDKKKRQHGVSTVETGYGVSNYA